MQGETYMRTRMLYQREITSFMGEMEQQTNMTKKPESFWFA